MKALVKLNIKGMWRHWLFAVLVLVGLFWVLSIPIWMMVPNLLGAFTICNILLWVTSKDAVEEWARTH